MANRFTLLREEHAQDTHATLKLYRLPMGRAIVWSGMKVAFCLA